MATAGEKTPTKSSKTIEYTPTTKQIVCILCGKGVTTNEYRRKLFHGQQKTDACLLVEKYIGIDVSSHLHTDTVCRNCLISLKSVDKIVTKLQSSYDSTIEGLKVSHGRSTNKRGSSASTDTSKLKRKSLFADSGNETDIQPLETENVRKSTNVSNKV